MRPGKHRATRGVIHHRQAVANIGAQRVVTQGQAVNTSDKSQRILGIDSQHITDIIIIAQQHQLFSGLGVLNQHFNQHIAC